MLAVDSSMGALPTETTMIRARSLGLSVEHPVFQRVRVLAGYEWLWLGEANGHRTTLGLRREVFGRGRYHSRVFVDGELGASYALVSGDERMAGVHDVPAAFAGMRMGYDLYTDRDESPSRTFELALGTRLLVVEHGVGFALGLAVAWGN